MFQHELRPRVGSKKQRKRVGRGNASGHGTYSGRGIKGQKARSGPGIRVGFEGGQLPLVRRMARKRGFNNKFRVEYTPVNVGTLARFPTGSEVTPESLREAGVIKTLRRPVKILGDGDLGAALTVRAHRVSASARQKIEAAGGSVEEMSPRAAASAVAEETEASEDQEESAAQEATPEVSDGGSSESAETD